MKDWTISEVRIHRLGQKTPEPLNWCAGKGFDSMETNVIEVRTEGGQIGWGDGFVRTDILQANPELVIGRTPFEAAKIFDQTGGRARREESSGGLDCALWDLQGRLLNKPVYELFSTPFRKRFMAYASVGYLKDSWADPVQGMIDDLVYWKEQGYHALKMKTGYGVEMDAAMINGVRAAVGPDIKLCVDSGSPGMYDSGSAIRLGGMIQDARLEFWEEPVEQWDFDAYRRLKQMLPIPLAAGESMYVNEVLLHFGQTGLLDIIQPDIERCGFTGGMRLMHTAWLNRMRVIPHTWAHTPLRIAATLHWLACWAPEHTRHVNPPQPLLELHPPHEAVANDLTVESIAIDPADGMVSVPEGPGLGLTVKPEVLEQYRIGSAIIIK